MQINTLCGEDIRPLTGNEPYIQSHSCKFNTTLKLFLAETLLTAVFFSEQMMPAALVGKFLHSRWYLAREQCCAWAAVIACRVQHIHILLLMAAHAIYLSLQFKRLSAVVAL